MTDAYNPTLRLSALKRVQTTHPFLFPAAHVKSGLGTFAIGPGESLDKSMDEYVQFIDDTYTKKDLLAMWPKIEKRALDAFLSTAISVDKQLTYNDTSINEMILYAVTLKDRDLITLADDRHEAVLKSQRERASDLARPETINNAFFEFTNEVIVSRLLNSLVTSFKHTVTPHYTTFLGCFKSNDLPKKGNGAHVFALYERAKLSLKDYVVEHFKHNTLDPAKFGVIIFTTVSALAASSHVLGKAHNDLHLGNIMMREVANTKYADSHWAYKLRDMIQYIIIPPTMHDNLMVEIIDEGRATLTTVEPDSPGSQNALRFVLDVRHMLEDVVRMYLEHRTKPVAKPIADVMTKIESLLVKWPLRTTSPRKREKDTMVVNAIYRGWHNEEFLGFLFYHFMGKKAPTNIKPLVVSITPEENILAHAGDDPMVAELATLWKIPQGMKRAYSVLNCRTCTSPSQYATENQTHGFCGVDCYNVFYGEMNVA
jgi:hypothetical protein